MHPFKPLVILVISMLAQQAYCDTASDWANQASFAQAQLQKAGSQVNAWASQEQAQGYGDVPNYSNHPDQARYQDNPSAMGQDAAVKLATDKNAQATQKAFNNRGQYTINNQTPFLKTANDVQNNIDAIMAGSYPGCKQEKHCDNHYEYHQCKLARNETLSCTKKLNITVDYKPYAFDCNHLSQNGFQFSLIPGPSSDGMCVTGFTYFYVGGINQNYDVQNTVKITLPPNVTAHANMALRALDSNWNFNPANGDKLSFEIKGDGVVPDLSIVNPAFAPDAHGNVLYGATGKDFSTPAQDNVVNLSFEYHLYSHGPITGIQPAIFYITYPNQAFNNSEITKTWVNSCQTLPSACKLSNETCVDQVNPKIINGQSLTEGCWQYTQKYQCQGPQSQDTCGAYKDTCNATASECDPAYSVAGICLLYNQTYACGKEDHCSTQLNCGMDTFCINGDCYKPDPKENKNFGRDEAQFAAVSGALDSVLKSGAMNAFSGSASSCNKDFLGYLNCCADKGWGQDLNLAKCSEDEKKLGAAKAKGLTVYVGEYCSKKVLGACVQHKQSYCVFPSLMAFDVQTQGRKNQLGISFGVDKNPDCRGLSVDELQKLDFSKMDFSNLEAELKSKVQLPQDSQTQQNITDTIEHMQEGQ